MPFDIYGLYAKKIVILAIQRELRTCYKKSRVVTSGPTGFLGKQVMMEYYYKNYPDRILDQIKLCLNYI